MCRLDGWLDGWIIPGFVQIPLDWIYLSLSRICVVSLSFCVDERRSGWGVFLFGQLLSDNGLRFTPSFLPVNTLSDGCICTLRFAPSFPSSQYLLTLSTYVLAAVINSCL